MSEDLSAQDLSVVGSALIAAGLELAGPLVARRLAGGRSNLTFVIEDGLSKWVLRMPPREGRTQSAHDVAREFRVTKALIDTDVPVPPPVLLQEDPSSLGVPFAVAEFVPGTSVQTREGLDLLDDDTVASVAVELVRELAGLHRVDHAAAGLTQFAKPDAYAERQTTRWARQWDVVGDRRLDPLARELASSLLGALPPQRSTGIVHGDFRIDNTLLDLADGPKVAAIVDWELCTLGDPVADVALMCAYRHQAFDFIIGRPTAWTSPRLPDAAELAAAYVDAGGLPLDHFEYHLALANFKIGVIAAGIAYRNTLSGDPHADHASAGAAVEPFLRAGLQLS